MRASTTEFRAQVWAICPGFDAAAPVGLARRASRGGLRITRSQKYEVELYWYNIRAQKTPEAMRLRSGNTARIAPRVILSLDQHI